jgi:biopolymer transport protein TolQ
MIDGFYANEWRPTLLTTLASTQVSVGEFDIFQDILETRGVILAIVIVLVVMSLVCWFIIAYKWFWFRRLARVTREFTESYWDAQHPNQVYELARDGEQCPHTRIFIAGYHELGRIQSGQKASAFAADGFENVERAIQRTQRAEVGALERWVPFLATTGATAPFIGLFGTVWGIMRAFAGLGTLGEEVNLLTSVTPHIAEALVATAIGLVAAIPAVMAYNYFVNRIKLAVGDMEGFGSDYLNALRRLFMTQPK